MLTVTNITGIKNIQQQLPETIKAFMNTTKRQSRKYEES